MKIAFDPIYCHPLPEGHRFPMLKYELIPEQLVYEGTVTANHFFSPKPVDLNWVRKVHSVTYLNDLLNISISPKMERRIGFPITPKLVERELIITQGTIDCCHHALKDGIAMNVAGGTHHAYSDKGEGFCLLNDVAIASMYLLENNLANQILVIDLDVHQGNGTAEIFQNEPRVFTFTMHGEENYPLKKEKSDLDIALPTYTKDEDYLSKLYETLPKLIESVKPDFLFFISGVDILESDRLGKLSCSIDGCKKRDEFVFEQAKANSIPIVVAMGGGYSPQIRTIVDAHCNTFRAGLAYYF
ncbi:Acetoin utilization deacetylase AcuC [Spirosomataceae bacterium TFI 002]|nr:Acetoin utilization deacetylase AcuC [Spirosomataceae bacterium TFI 002]